jgi:hypothetical protein
MRGGGVGTEVDAAADRRAMLIAFAGFMVMVSGAVTIVQGLWAIDHKGNGASKVTASQLSYANLETWGWIMLILGTVAFFTSFAIFAGAKWGRWLGIIVTSVSLLLMFFWVFAFPLAAFGVIFIDVLVIFALFTAGDPELSPA